LLTFHSFAGIKLTIQKATFLSLPFPVTIRPCFRITPREIPSSVGSVALIQSLPSPEWVIAQIKQYNRDELKQVIVYLTHENESHYPILITSIVWSDSFSDKHL
jgi:hypothetical protein